MELYALIGIAVIVVVLTKKLARLTTRVSAPPPPVIKPFNPTRVPNGLDDLLRCSKKRPPSPMSSSSDFVMDPAYIK